MQLKASRPGQLIIREHPCQEPLGPIKRPILKYFRAYTSGGCVHSRSQLSNNKLNQKSEIKMNHDLYLILVHSPTELSSKVFTGTTVKRRGGIRQMLEKRQFC